MTRNDSGSQSQVVHPSQKFGSSKLLAPGENRKLENIQRLQFKSHDGKQLQRSESGLQIDFTFNTIKNVKKVQWKEEAPWYREIYDGFCWLAYCNNSQLSEEAMIKAEMRAKLGPQATNQMTLDDF